MNALFTLLLGAALGVLFACAAKPVSDAATDVLRSRPRESFVLASARQPTRPPRR